MENSLFSFDPFDRNLQNPLTAYVEILEKDGVTISGHNHLKRRQYSEDFGNICYDQSGLLQDITAANGELFLSRDCQQPFSDFGMLNEHPFDAVSTPVQTFPESSAQSSAVQSEVHEVSKVQKEKRIPFSFTSTGLLNNSPSDLTMLNFEKPSMPSDESTCSTKVSRSSSTEEIMRMAGARYIKLSYKSDDDLHMTTGQHLGLPLLGFSDQEIKDVELAHLLLASAERVGKKQFERASKLINQCLHSSLDTGSPVERVVYYFARALRDRVDRESGRITPISSKTNGRLELDVEEKLPFPTPFILGCFENLPFFKMLHFTGMQAIIEKVASHKKVHVIDLGIRMGAHWIILMQALAAAEPRQIEVVKMTVVGTTARQEIEETGNRLANFAKTLNVPFSFKLIMLSDMKDLKEDLFDIEPDEAIAVYAPFSMRHVLSRPGRLETLLRVVTKLKPVTMVVIEIEANHNSPSFVSRFVESLFFYGAFFDSLDVCMDRNDPNRMIMEAIYLNDGIQNIIVAEGKERLAVHVKIEVWREFFARFGIVEMELSQSSLYQANLILQQFACGNSCTLHMNGKSLIAGWKATPIYSLSVWKFQ